MPDQDKKLININVDGTDYQVEEGLNIIQACKRVGIHVPHFCYHSCLSVAGNCRMCLVRVEKIPKLAIACGTKISDGMIIHTNTPEVIKARESVMEFLLINHPLDCPVCDQAGECTLQDYSYKYGKDSGRFREDRNIKHTKDFGHHVKYWGSRCILCTRCVRFCREVSGTGELAVNYRGDHAVIDVFPGKELQNDLSMNVVDLCPVGALVSADFLYEARVWNLRQEKTICPECSKGCNVRVDSLNNFIKRIVPRRNLSVNLAFMCDHGRLNYNYIYSNKRLKRVTAYNKNVNWKEGIDQCQSIIKKYISQSKMFAILVSSWNSTETLYLVKKFKDKFLPDAKIYFYGRKSDEDKSFPQFTISGDKNPNMSGIEAIFGAKPSETDEENLSIEMKNGNIHGCLVLGGVPDGFTPVEFVENTKYIKDIITIDHTANTLTEISHIVLPGLTYAEKNGTFINDKKRVQKIVPVINPFAPGKNETEILQEIMVSLDGNGVVLSINEIFEEMRNLLPFKNIEYNKLGNLGSPIS